MQLIRVFLRGSLFFALTFGISSSLGFLIHDELGAGIAAGLLGVLLLWNALRWKALWNRELRARRVQVIGHLEIYYVNDPSSHLFLMKSPLGSGGAIYMTRGILSLLSPEELDALVIECSSALRQFGLGWNVFLSSLQLRVMKGISSRVLQLFYTSHSPEVRITPRATLASLPLLGLVDLLRRFSLPFSVVSDESRNQKRYLFDRLLAESYVCPPRISAAAAAHALIDPWPRALLRTSESCAAEKAWLTFS